MALCGLAILVKPTSLFERVAIGLGHLLALWRSERRLATLFARAAAMIAVAIVPTVAAFAAYALVGHADAMWDATILSIFRKGAMSAADRFATVDRLLYALSVPVVLAIAALSQQWRQAPDRAPVAFLSLWLGGAMIGFVSVPYFFVHYALPLAVPVTIAAAFVLGDRRDGHMLMALACVLPIVALPRSPAKAEHYRSELARLTEDIVGDGRGGCLYVYGGPLQLHALTGACRATRFIFPTISKARSRRMRCRSTPRPRSRRSSRAVRPMS